MNKRKMRMAAIVLAAGLSGAAQAALQARDLDGNVATAEAYYDTVLDITWLANADVSGPMGWAAANSWAANLSFYDAVNNVTYDNWRLPTVNPINGTSFNYNWKFNGSTDFGYNISEQGTAFAGSTGSEMAHLFYNTLDNKGYCPVSTDCSPAAQPGWGLTNTGPFTNLQDYSYWSGSEYASDTGKALYFSFFNGSQYADPKNYGYLALAVSPGDVAAVPEAETWAMLLAGLGLLGISAHHRKINHK